MKLYGQAHPVVFGDSIIRGGSISGLSGTLPAGRVTQVGFDSEGTLWALVGGLETTKDLIYLIPGTGQFKTAGSNLSAEAFTWEPDRTILIAPSASRVSGSREGPDERLSALPVTKKTFNLLIETTVFGCHPRISPL
ncbi:hypothetical protein [Tunturiibacter gelidiferens]|uniref:hypothetical protein n=1 Tax=Tunturiibacter gelidiferens TaxID=3069689 RepID=UPI003D9B3315